MLGAVVEAIGIAILAWALWIENDGVIYGMMALTGVGVGIRFMPVPLHGMAYFPKRIAAVISLSEVSDPFGGTLGLTIMTTVLNNVAGVGDIGDGGNYDFSQLQHMSDVELEDMKERAKKGIVFAFIAIFPFMVLVSHPFPLPQLPLLTVTCSASSLQHSSETSTSAATRQARTSSPTRSTRVSIFGLGSGARILTRTRRMLRSRGGRRGGMRWRCYQ